MKKNLHSKRLWISFVLVCISSPIFYCVFAFFHPFFHGIWTGLITPRHKVIEIDKSARMAIQIQPNPAGIEWLGLKWSTDGNSIELRNSRGEAYTSATANLDLKKFTLGSPEYTKRGQYPGRTNTYPFRISENEWNWGSCPKKRFNITGRENNSRSWELRFWKNQELTFSYAGINDEYWESHRAGPGRISPSGFSPDCRYFALQIDEEMWLLNTDELTFELYYKARRFIIPNMDYPYQDIYPRWSTNNRDLVFGDYAFGIETFDILTRQRRFLMETGLKASYPTWSKTGNWVSAVRHGNNFNSILTIISPNGDLIAFPETCRYIEEPEWSPTDERFAILCSQYDTCMDNQCLNKNKYLIIWSLEGIEPGK